MEVTGNGTAGEGSFRSSYLNALVKEYHKARAQEEMHKETLKQAQKRYRGEMLQEITAEENRQHQDQMAAILRTVDTLTEKEKEHLEACRKDELTGSGRTDDSILARLDRIGDIISRDELQMVADAHKDSSLVQRKLYRIAERRGLYIDTYPGYDEKITTLLQTAADIKGFIHSQDFGLSPAIYITSGMEDADDILIPVKKTGGGIHSPVEVRTENTENPAGKGTENNDNA